MKTRYIDQAGRPFTVMIGRHRLLFSGLIDNEDVDTYIHRLFVRRHYTGFSGASYAH